MRARSFSTSLCSSFASFAEVAERFIHIGAVGHLVQDRLGVGPEPRDRPEQSAEDKARAGRGNESRGSADAFSYERFFPA